MDLERIAEGSTSPTSCIAMPRRSTRATGRCSPRCSRREAVYTIGAHGDFIGPQAIGDKIASLIGGYESTQHMITNPVIEIDGDRARASCYLHGQHYMPDQRTGGNTYEMGGTYRDELVRTADGWRITRRVLDVAWREGNAAISAEAQKRFGEASG